MVAYFTEIYSKSSAFADGIDHRHQIQAAITATWIHQHWFKIPPEGTFDGSFNHHSC